MENVIWVSPRGLGLEFAYRLQDEHGLRVLVYTPERNRFVGLLREWAHDPDTLAKAMHDLKGALVVVDDLMEPVEGFASKACEMAKNRRLRVIHDANAVAADLFRDTDAAHEAAAILGVSTDGPPVGSSMIREGVVFSGGQFHSAHSWLVTGAKLGGLHQAALSWVRRRPLYKWDGLREYLAKDGYEGHIAVRIALGPNGGGSFSGFEPGWAYPFAYAWHAMQVSLSTAAWVDTLRSRIDRGQVALAASLKTDAPAGTPIACGRASRWYRGDVGAPGDQLLKAGEQIGTIVGCGESTTDAVSDLDAVRRSMRNSEWPVAIEGNAEKLLDRYRGLHGPWR